MSNYQLKYYLEYCKLNSILVNRVEIWENTLSVLIAEEIRGCASPFSVELPEMKHKFQTVRGKGCTINLLSDTDMKFFTSLYHVDPQTFMIRHYVNGMIDFHGFLNAEMISEPYDINFNYQVSLTGNDGFSLMDRFSLVQADASIYTGIKSKFELLEICFKKILLPYDEFWISLSTTFADYSGSSSSTILHESYVDCANFYNEDPAPMSLREVVESILAPYGAFITAINGHIYITDIHTLASNDTITFKRFGLWISGYGGSTALNNVKEISAIGYTGTGQSIEMSGGVNKQVITYSPYPTKTILDKSIIELNEFTTVPESWSLKNGYNYKTLETDLYWEIDFAKTISLNPTTFEASYYGMDNENNANIYARYPTYGGLNSRVMSLKNGQYTDISGAVLSSGTVSSSNVSGNVGIRRRSKYVAGVAFLITGDIFIKTKNNPYDTLQTSKNIKGFGFSFRIKVGNKYYDISDNSWTTTPTNSMIFTYDGENTIADKFLPIGNSGEGMLITIGSLTQDIVIFGNVELEIWSEHKMNTNTSVDFITNSTDIQEVWLKNMAIKLVNYDGSDIADKDIQYIGLLNKAYQNEGDKIELKCGTDSLFADRGKILWNNAGEYNHIMEWTRNSQTFKIEELLLNSVCSNYRAGAISLLSMKLRNNFSLLNILTDTFIGSKRMMIKSANVNYYDNTVDCSLVEILPDSLTIVPSVVVGSV